MEKNANKAIALNITLDVPHILLGWIHLFKKEHDKAIESGKQAIILNPNGADSLAHFGFISHMAGEIEVAIRNLKKSFRLNPIPPAYYYHFLGGAYAYDRQYDKALEILTQSLSIDSEVLTPYLNLTAVYIELSKLDQAKKFAKKILEISPSFSLEYHKNAAPIKDQEELERYIENLRKAGLPE